MWNRLKTVLSMRLCFAIFIGTVVHPVSVFAWGDNGAEGNGRPSYTMEEINSGAIGATIVSEGEDYKSSDNYPGQVIFNTISDSDRMGGNEKNFVAARKCTILPSGRLDGAIEDAVWNANDITVEPGGTYVIRLYVHNNNPNGTDAVAENTHVSFSIPNISGTQVKVNGFIDSSNAMPSEYWDYVNFNSPDTSLFHLEYIHGSAWLENNGIGISGLPLSDDIVKAKSGGVLIGYDALDGRVPGCYQYDNFVTIMVKAVFDADFTVETKVRLADSEDKTWFDSIDAKVCDKVQFRILYTNTSDREQKNVAVKDILPPNLKYVSGSSIIKNINHEDGAYILSDALVTNGIRIGHYATNGSNALIYFTAEVVDESLTQGLNTLVNWAQAGVGSVTIQDFAEVRVRNNIGYYGNLSVHGVMAVVCLLIIVVAFWRKCGRGFSKIPKDLLERPKQEFSMPINKSVSRFLKTGWIYTLTKSVTGFILRKRRKPRNLLRRK